MTRTATTMIGAVRLDGTSACMTIEGATNAEVFRVYRSHKVFNKPALLPNTHPAFPLIHRSDFGLFPSP